MANVPKLDVVTIEISELVEYKNNAKLHTNEQIDQIAESISKFGFNNPILAWHNEDGDAEIVAGHGRLLAARKLGLESLPVLFLDHLTPEQRQAYIIVDNKLSMDGTFDEEMLARELEAVSKMFDMSEFGFDLSDVDEMLEEDAIELDMQTPQKAEVPFSQWVDEASNYVVLTFHTEKDWLRAQSLLDLPRVRSHSTKRDGNGKLVFTGMGRVIDGNEAFKRIAMAEKELER